MKNSVRVIGAFILARISTQFFRFDLNGIAFGSEMIIPVRKSGVSVLPVSLEACDIARVACLLFPETLRKKWIAW